MDTFSIPRMYSHILIDTTSSTFIMITQHRLDTITENLAAELNLRYYNHPHLAEIVRSQLTELIDDVTKHPSHYFSVDVLQAAKTTANSDFQGINQK